MIFAELRNQSFSQEFKPFGGGGRGGGGRSRNLRPWTRCFVQAHVGGEETHSFGMAHCPRGSISTLGNFLGIDKLPILVVMLSTKIYFN